MPNETCHRKLAQDGPPLLQNGKLVFQTYHIGWIITGSFAAVSTITSLWLINRHLQWYTCRTEQRYIVRILFMVPIYALISFASFLFWNHSTALLLVRDGYESIVLTAFFYLLLIYLSPDVEEQKSIFLRLGLSREADNEARRKGQKVIKWIFPLGFAKWKPSDGLYFLQLMKWGVLQYCVIRPATTLIAVILEYMGLYCEESWGLEWGHIYITTVVSVSVTIAMYCLIQLYVPVRANLASHKPLLKLFVIKAVVFLTFWQATLLSLLGMFGVVKDTKYMTAADINIGIGSLLETFEMMVFAFLHLRAFTYTLYRPSVPSSLTDPPKHKPRLRSLGHAMDFRETFREIWSGWLYIVHKLRGKEPKSDVRAKRIGYYKKAFGRPRAPAAKKTEIIVPKHKSELHIPVEVEVEEQVDVDIEGEKQWLGSGDNHEYRLRYFQREGSNRREVQIGRELERRGYMPHAPIGPDIDAQAPLLADVSTEQNRQRSWWRSIHDRVSLSSQGSQSGPHLNSSSIQGRRPSKSLPQRPLPYGEADQGFLHHDGYNLNDPPPPSVMRAYHDERRSTRNLTKAGEYVLAPLPVLNKPQQRNVQPKQMLKDLIMHPKHVNSQYSVSPGILDNSVASTPVQPPSPMDSIFGRVFPHQSGSSHSNTDYRVIALERTGQSRSTRSPTAPMTLVQDYEFRVTRERVVSQAMFGHHATPVGSTTEVVTLPSFEPDRDSRHRREAALLHPPFNFSSSSACSVAPITPVMASDVSGGSGGRDLVQSDPWEIPAVGNWQSSTQPNVTEARLHLQGFAPDFHGPTQDW